MKLRIPKADHSHRYFQADTLRLWRKTYRDAVAAGPIVTPWWCEDEDCDEEHIETHYAPAADALMMVWSNLHTLALVRRFEGARPSRFVARLIAQAETGGARMDLTADETQQATLNALAGALGAPLPTST